MKKIFFLLSCFLFSNLFAQNNSFQCYPTNWWTGMKWNHVQIMIYGKGIGNATGYMINYPGVTLKKSHRVDNINYEFLDIVIAPSTKPGILKIHVKQKDSSFVINFPIKKRRPGNGNSFAQGVTSKDFIYLIMPDRFSNGDTTNDRIAGMRDQSLNRDTVFMRHGGDLKGIENHLDYLKSLGVTALWLNPVIENDMPERTEHGYAFTNHYKIDRRLGGEKAYHSLVNAAHAKNMKIIQDAVYNHIGSYHFTVLDPPMKTWLHQWPDYTNTSYKDQVLFDPYASDKEKKIMQDGWFVPSMPDLNQGNPFVANFLIQHALWTVEEFGIDGWRIDTYIYNDLDFMNRCNKALMDEYPKITMFGETWVHGVLNQSYFVQNNFNIPYKSNLQAATDFQTLWGITDAMTKDFGWTEGVNKLYTTLAQDFVYKDPMRNVIFLDNHDLSRFYSVVDTNMLKYKAALAWLFTCRGIPQIYYGDEIGMQGFTTPNDGHVRLDFPGGWASDGSDKFTEAGRTVNEQKIWIYISTLTNFRKNSSAITTGKMMQFAPVKGEYVFFRYDSKQTIMTILNTSKENVNISIKNYSERTNGFSKMKNIITGEISLLEDFSMSPMESGVWELEK
ncbi:glycoside hydrolase family 13 protein [Hanamia caeni]|uniref:glycoside hydrolase family 13 protein n=1 Tax=Hanamia caeni TaxID=2294116 RepID=UPI001F45E46E|nr:glycoside hydrolase family 13 protein [Hanamia caeni]